MPGYLDQYGEGDERRARKIKIIVVSIAGLVVATGILYYSFHNLRHERQVKRFFQLLANRDYQSAYQAWGCTASRPCSGYPMDAFLHDWGPPVVVKGFTILDGESCANSVIVDVDAGAAGDRKVWVDRDTLELSLPPNERGCVQAVVDESGNLYYRSLHNRIYEWFRNLKYRLHGRTYQAGS
jgi:hypothetical protein